MYDATRSPGLANTCVCAEKDATCLSRGTTRRAGAFTWGSSQLKGRIAIRRLALGRRDSRHGMANMETRHTRRDGIHQCHARIACNVGAFRDAAQATVAATSEANMRYQMEFDFDRDASRAFATSKDFTRSGWDLVGAQSTDTRSLSAIGRQNGSSPRRLRSHLLDQRHRKWLRTLDAANNGKAADLVRVFPVPGMNHCSRRSGDRSIQCARCDSRLGRGRIRAPDRIEAEGGLESPWAGKTRRGCHFPEYAGSKAGDVWTSPEGLCLSVDAAEVGPSSKPPPQTLLERVFSAPGGLRPAVARVGETL